MYKTNIYENRVQYLNDSYTPSLSLVRQCIYRKHFQQISTSFWIEKDFSNTHRTSTSLFSILFIKFIHFRHIQCYFLIFWRVSQSFKYTFHFNISRKYYSSYPCGFYRWENYKPSIVYVCVSVWFANPQRIKCLCDSSWKKFNKHSNNFSKMKTSFFRQKKKELVKELKNAWFMQTRMWRRVIRLKWEFYCYLSFWLRLFVLACVCEIKFMILSTLMHG